jgi:hypothetical protein
MTRSRHRGTNLNELVEWFMGACKVSASSYSCIDTTRWQRATEIHGTETIAVVDTIKADQPKLSNVATTRITINTSMNLGINNIVNQR